MRRSFAMLSCALLLGMAACSDTELVGVHVQLKPDGSGVITSRTLLQPGEAGPAETRTEGVAWQERATLAFSQGSFQSIGNLKFGEIRFGGDIKSVDRPGVRVFVARGPEVAWIKALVPDQETRKKLARVYDPTGKTPEIAASVRIEMELPGNVIASGVLPTARGVEATHERSKAYLVIPVQTALEKGDELVWEVSWVAPH